MKDRDGNEFVWVPREAVRKMLDAAHFGPNCAEDELSAKDEQFWLEVWGAMIAAAPQFVAGEVTPEMCERVWIRRFPTYFGADDLHRAITRRWLEAWRAELGPTLGLVELKEPTPEECERIITAWWTFRGDKPFDGRAMFDACRAVMWPKEGL